MLTSSDMNIYCGLPGSAKVSYGPCPHVGLNPNGIQLSITSSLLTPCGESFRMRFQKARQGSPGNHPSIRPKSSLLLEMDNIAIKSV
jgi:hypothetical protein